VSHCHATICFSFVLAVACSSCSKPIANLSSLTINLDDGWTLTVRADGSGQLSYGSSWGDGVHFGPGTLDLSSYSSRLRSTLTDRVTSLGPRVVLERTNGGSTAHGSTSDRLCRTLVQGAFDHVVPGTIQSHRLTQIVRENPIMPKD
jgi:hypothetical protein